MSARRAAGAQVPFLNSNRWITGNQIRHITIQTPADLERPEIRSYIRRARKLAIADARKLGEKSLAAPQKHGEVISVVKAVYKKKRRPGSKS